MIPLVRYEYWYIMMTRSGFIVSFLLAVIALSEAADKPNIKTVVIDDIQLLRALKGNFTTITLAADVSLGE